MARTTKTLYRVNLRINRPREDQIERVCEYARKQGHDFSPHSVDVWDFMLERWVLVLEYLAQVEKELDEKKLLLGKLR